MANTERSTTTLLAEQDKQTDRDLIASLMGTVGATAHAYINTSTNVAINTANILTTAVGTLTASGYENDFTVSGNKITYNGTATRTVLVRYGANVGLTASGNSKVAIGIKKNTSIITASIRTSRLLTGTTVSTIATVPLNGTTLVRLTSGDYIKFAVKNVTSTQSMVLQSAELTLMGTFAR